MRKKRNSTYVMENITTADPSIMATDVELVLSSLHALIEECEIICCKRGQTPEGRGDKPVIFVQGPKLFVPRYLMESRLHSISYLHYQDILDIGKVSRYKNYAVIPNNGNIKRDISVVIGPHTYQYTCIGFGSYAVYNYLRNSGGNPEIYQKIMDYSASWNNK